MAGTITALKIQKRNKDRVNVYIEDAFGLAVTRLAAAGLATGQYLTDAEIERLKQGDAVDKAYDRALRFLGLRPRSQVEVERYLQDKGYPPEVVASAVQRLLARQYLDDQAFVQFWVENREKFRPRGQRALRYELRQKGISERVIETALADVAEAELAWAAVEKKLNGWRNLPAVDLKKKIAGFLGRRGFNYEVVNQAIERALTTLQLSEDSESCAWD
jgi:regulatory protein